MRLANAAGRPPTRPGACLTALDVGVPVVIDEVAPGVAHGLGSSILGVFVRPDEDGQEIPADSQVLGVAADVIALETHRLL